VTLETLAAKTRPAGSLQPQDGREAEQPREQSDLVTVAYRTTVAMLRGSAP
jgi:hypothetical protein